MGNGIMRKVFTGQRVIRDTYIHPKAKASFCEIDDAIRHNRNADIFVECPICNQEVGLGRAYIDKYIIKGKELYVHYSCLSQERSEEIKTINRMWGPYHDT